jgi:uncharacterized protein involved in exopolysaccharide biosynthesis
VIRYLETFFRHRLLFTAPVVLALVFSLGFALLQPETYTAQARVWYDLKGGLDTNSADQALSRYTTPAEQQAQVLDELIVTRAFDTKVAQRGPLAGYVRTQDGYAEAVGGVSSLKVKLKGLFGAGGPQVQEGQANDLAYGLLSTNVTAFAVGPQIVLVTMSLHNAAVAEATLQALLDQYSDEILGDRRTQAQTAIGFWQQQADKARSDLQGSEQAVTQYIGQHPQLAQSNSSLDPTLTSLRHTYDQNTTRYQSLLDKVDQARLDLAASTTPATSGFRLIDPPRSVSSPLGVRRQLMLAGGGLFVGLLISLAGVVGMTLLDPTFRRRDDIKHMLGLTVVGTIPKVVPPKVDAGSR